MKLPLSTKSLTAVAVAAALSGSVTAGALAQSVNVTLNGSPVSLNPAPQTRAGRVFVPLRGIFENLGASVVYANGVINAQGNGHAVSLKIGSTQATVNGAPQMLDVAPFIIGASTFVPLRFVSQALGATVNYDGGNHIVAISNGGSGGQNPPPQTVTAAPAPQAMNTVKLTNEAPGNGSAIKASRPAISAKFSEAVDTSSVKITLDDRDVSSSSYLNPNQFDFTPTYDLPASEHTVKVTGKSAAGVPFNRSWKFTSGTDVVANYITKLSPAEGTAVGNPFKVTGVTLPNSKIRIVASGSATLGGLIRLGGSTYTTDVTADANGNFAAEVPLQNISGGDVILAVQSVSPAGQGIAKRVALRSQ
ncbi:MAG: hypothetical protein NVS2B17_00770 [Candidatus Velthaea sp.]